MHIENPCYVSRQDGTSSDAPQVIYTLTNLHRCFLLYIGYTWVIGLIHMQIPDTQVNRWVINRYIVFPLVGYSLIHALYIGCTERVSCF